jgi:hypothetical protein
MIPLKTDKEIQDATAFAALMRKLPISSERGDPDLEAAFKDAESLQEMLEDLRDSKPAKQ